MKTLTLVGLMMILSACGKATTATVATGTTTTVTGTISTEVSIKSDDKIIAYILSIAGDDSVDIYIPSADRYAYIQLSTGNYVQTQSYFSGVGCTGTMMAGSWVGQVTKSVIYSNSAYYLITGTSTASFAYQSYWNTITQACVNASSSTTAGLELGTVSATTQPYSFTLMAPITPSFN